MSQSVAAKLNQGISPKAFMDGMTKNKEAFIALYDSFAWPDEDLRAYFDSLNNRDDLRCLILAADWCGDVLRNVPVVVRAMETAGIKTEILVMEQHLDLIDQHLTLGGRSIPVVFIADTGGVILGKWGPRPQYVQEPMVAFKQGNPDREAPDYQTNLAATREEIKRRYGEGTGYQADILRELRELLERV